MDTAAAPDDLRRDALLGEAYNILRWLINELESVLAPRGQGLKMLRWIARHYLLPAEGMMRRALRLIADTLPPPPKPALPRVLRQAQDEGGDRVPAHASARADGNPE